MATRPQLHAVGMIELVGSQGNGRGHELFGRPRISSGIARQTGKELPVGFVERWKGDPGRADWRSSRRFKTLQTKKGACYG